MSMNRVRVVLVEPENPLNIGFVARSLRCCGVTALTVVSPSLAPIPDEAYRTGTAAKEVLANAQIVSTLAEAVETAHFTVAFSRRHFSVVQQECSLPELTSFIPNDTEVALIFGRESVGLTTAEIASASLLCSIPSTEGISHNLSHAVTLALYELTRQSATNREPSAVDLPSQSEFTALLTLIHQRCDPAVLARGNRADSLAALMGRSVQSVEDMSLLFSLFKGIR